MEELEFILEATEESMVNSISFLEKELLNIRAGKANPNMLSSVKVDYYGAQTPLNQIANINTPDSQTLSIQPWEKDKLEDIEKAILSSNLGFNPMNNGESISNLPSLLLIDYSYLLLSFWTVFKIHLYTFCTPLSQQKEE